MTLFDLSGKVALVTGANKGLGQGIALALAQAGADIAAVSKSDADETARRVQALGRRFVFIKADLSAIAPIEPIISTTVNNLGRLDILVNNSGLIRRADAIDFTEADWDDVMNVNIKATFFLCQAAGRHMIAQGYGKIINIASMLSFQGGIRVPSYAASKSGIAGITRLLANEWAARGINVNAIAPGYMATPTRLNFRPTPNVQPGCDIAAFGIQHQLHKATADEHKRLPLASVLRTLFSAPDRVLKEKLEAIRRDEHGWLTCGSGQALILLSAPTDHAVHKNVYSS